MLDDFMDYSKRYNFLSTHLLRRKRKLVVTIQYPSAVEVTIMFNEMVQGLTLDDIVMTGVGVMPVTLSEDSMSDGMHNFTLYMVVTGVIYCYAQKTHYHTDLCFPLLTI